MLVSKPYDYYRDRDDQNLGLKVRHSFKEGFRMGIIFAVLEISLYRRPKNFATMLAPFGKWTLLGGIACSIQAAITYSVAVQRNENGPFNHFWGGLGPAVVLAPWFKTPHSFFMTTLLTGGWASYQKFKMMEFNTTNIFDDNFVKGAGGLYQGQHSLDALITRNVTRREDPGRRELYPEI